MSQSVQTPTPGRHTRRQLLLGTAGAAALGLGPSPSRAAGRKVTGDALPGTGITVLPVKSALAEENFQTLLVMKALRQLGHTVKPWEELDYPLIHLSVANGDAKLSRKGVYAAAAAQGYMIDRKTAEQYQITHIDQLKDPALAALFDIDGDGKANLIGPNAGWGGEAVVAHHIKAFGLENTVGYTQGNYPALIADTLARFKAGKPVLYYAWTPYWLSNVLRPGQEVVWLQVTRSSMPGVQAGTDTRLPNGRNHGFPLNNEHIVANKLWAEENPAAGRLFEIMQIPITDISRQNRLLRDGENKPADTQRHEDAWIKAHQKTFDAWIAQARAAALKS